MTADTMPEPQGPEDERFVAVTVAGVEALREGAAAFEARGRFAPLATCGRPGEGRDAVCTLAAGVVHE